MTTKRAWALKTKTIELNAPIVMGILNVTPDSFSDGARFQDAQTVGKFRPNLDAILDAVEKMIRDGARVVDVGGESTRPGAAPVDEAEEIRRVAPVVRAIVRRFDVPVSVDTYRPATAEAALDEGAQIVNDVAAGRFLAKEARFAELEEDCDEEMAELVARRRAAVVLMHMRGAPDTMQTGDLQYPNGVVECAFDFLARRRDAFLARGVALERLAFDPGLGFGKSFDDNWRLVRDARRFRALGGVLLYGHSRKRFLRETLRRFDATRRVESDEGDWSRLDFATATTAVALARNGVDVLRVHNVAQTSLALELARRALNEPLENESESS